MRTFFVLLLMGVACSGTTSTTRPPVGAGSQPIRAARAAPAAPAVQVDAKEVEPEPPSDVKAPGNLPVRTRAQADAEAQALTDCLDTCEDADADCRQTCFVTYPVEQVEIVDQPIGPPPTE